MKRTHILVLRALLFAKPDDCGLWRKDGGRVECWTIKRLTKYLSKEHGADLFTDHIVKYALDSFREEGIVTLNGGEWVPDYNKIFAYSYARYANPHGLWKSIYDDLNRKMPRKSNELVWLGEELGILDKRPRRSVIEDDQDR